MCTGACFASHTVQLLPCTRDDSDRGQQADTMADTTVAPNARTSMAQCMVHANHRNLGADVMQSMQERHAACAVSAHGCVFE
jgi:hypothetical protein